MADGSFDMPRLSAQLYYKNTPEEDLLAMAAETYDDDNTGNTPLTVVGGIV